MTINKNHYNYLISIDRSFCHLPNNIKLAKSHIPTPTLNKQQIISSISRSYNTISAQFLTNLDKHISTISLTIINPSVIKKTKPTIHHKKQKNVEKLKKHLTPSPRVLLPVHIVPEKKT